MSPLFVLIFWNLEHGTTFHRVCSFFDRHCAIHLSYFSGINCWRFAKRRQPIITTNKVVALLSSLWLLWLRHQGRHTTTTHMLIGITYVVHTHMFIQREKQGKLVINILIIIWQNEKLSIIQIHICFSYNINK